MHVPSNCQVCVFFGGAMECHPFTSNDTDLYGFAFYEEFNVVTTCFEEREYQHTLLKMIWSVYIYGFDTMKSPFMSNLILLQF